jgi:replicative DNA helicase
MDDITKKVISSAMKDRFLLSRAIAEGLSKDLFESQEEKIIVDYVLKNYSKSELFVDVGLLKEAITEEGTFTLKVGELIDEIANEQPVSLELLLSYMDVLKRKYAEKEFLSIGKKIESYVELKAHKENIMDFAGNLIGELRGIVQGRVKRRLDPIRLNLIVFTAELESRTGEENLILGYSMEPFTLLTESLSGARQGFYYSLAGAPRRGKTNLMLKVASAIADNAHIPILYYSWEQTARVLFLRILSQQTFIPPYILETKNVLNDPTFSKRYDKGYVKVESFMNYVYLIEGRREDTMNRIRSHALSIMQEARTDKVAIFVDYLQKIPTSILYQDLAQQVDEVSGGLASLSLELNCPVFAISSFDKEGSKLDSEESLQRPTMFNSTGGGDIEYDTDVAMVIIKDFKDTNTLYEKIMNSTREGRVDPNRIPHFDILNLYIDKNRDAPFGGNIIIQYLFLIEDNNLVEIGYKDIAQDRTYAKISRVFDWMLENGYLVNMR